MKNEIEIEMVKGSQIGNCYYQHEYEVRSKQALSDAKIRALRAAGFLGYGQEFSFGRSELRNGVFVVIAINREDSSD